MSTCKPCKFAEKLPLEATGGVLVFKCRRYPPVTVVLNGQIIQTSPDATERCGEFKSKNDCQSGNTGAK